MFAFQSRLQGLIFMLQTEVCVQTCKMHMPALQAAACDYDAGTSTGSILAATIATAGAGVGNSGFLTTDTGMKQLYAVRRQKGFAIGSQRFSGRVMLKQISQKLHRARSTFWTSALTQSQVMCDHS